MNGCRADDDIALLELDVLRAEAGLTELFPTIGAKRHGQPICTMRTFRASTIR
jgi:hypothetical protein